MYSKVAFVFYFKFRAKSNFIVDSVSFYITEMTFSCCQDRRIPFHTLKLDIQDGRCGIMNAHIFATNYDKNMYDMCFCMFSDPRNPMPALFSQTNCK